MKLAKPYTGIAVSPIVLVTVDEVYRYVSELVFKDIV